MAESFWKKEISFGRKPKEQQAVPEADVAPAVKAVLDPSAEPVVLPAAAPQTAVPAQPDHKDTTDLPGVTGDYGWLTTSFDPNDVPDEMPAIVAPLVSLPTHASHPASVVPTVVAPEPLPGPDREAEQVAAIAPSNPAPFWKKELSFSRGAKAPKQPKAAKKPKQAKAPKETSAPFWKKELSFSRGAKQPVVAEAAVTTQVVTEAKTPFWKLELKRPPKGEKLDKQPKAAKQPREKKQKGVSAGAAKTGLVGLKIGASQVAAARVSNNGSPELLQIARLPLAEGIVVGGELRDVDALAEALKELFGKHKLPKRGVRLGIANNRIGVRTFEINLVDPPASEPYQVAKIGVQLVDASGEDVPGSQGEWEFDVRVCLEEKMPPPGASPD